MIDEINKNVDVDSVTGERIEQQADVPAVDIGRRFDQVAAELFSDFQGPDCSNGSNRDTCW